MIVETLNSILSGKEKSRLEEYEPEKSSLLYSVILEDSGVPNV